MKTIKFLFALVLIGAISFSCKKTEQDQDLKSPDMSAIQILSMDIEKVNQRLNDHMASLHDYQEQLAQTADPNRDCMTRVLVPLDAPTIQEAIEMVCEYGEVLVQSGTYTESVMVFDKPGIHIRAVGNVILNGDFMLSGNADGVIIEGFNIILPDYEFGWDAVYLIQTSGCVIKNNIISNQAYPGYNADDNGFFIIGDANDNQIKDNQISGMFSGISLVNPFPGITCSNNMIMGNLVSNVQRGILLLWDCDNNKIMQNQINNSIGPVVVGIAMAGFGHLVENNQIKLNDISYCFFYGIYMDYAFDNMIGPNNTTNYNGLNGITLLPSCEYNSVINNESLYNVVFDIWNGGLNNTFRANTAVTTYGL